MIRVPLSDFFEIYLGAVLLGTFLLWVVGNWWRRRKEQVARRRVVECSICSYTFQDPTRNPLPRCPNCGRLNERQTTNEL